ncbi:uncharacterized protein LOC119501921 isoform X2 [Xyrichtys novacula]|uniref:Uncharacterized protein LOC119501921 isoform X2 n=1 Tax=Xyrichtys novacula TaxID=13765 RepID=A0AAV1GTV5_XYRNO|nr:uncharacterized protein LOC119501921 isoform X2 [Xyrichtys novacula]
MDKKQCQEAGGKWDSLVKKCMLSRTNGRPAGPPTIGATSPTPVVSSMMVLSPAVWFVVVLVILASILAVALWFIIYKQHIRISRTPGAESQQDPPQKAEPPVVVVNNHAEVRVPSACSHLYSEAQIGSGWEGNPTEQSGTDEGRGLPLCSTPKEHRLPLPATELGGTVLVTTKTV